MLTVRDDRPSEHQRLSGRLCLVIQDCPDRKLVGRSVELEGSYLVIGRAEERSSHQEHGALWLQDDKVSSCHAILRANDGALRVRDCGSTNGTKLVGAEETNAREFDVAHGDTLKIGATLFKVLPVESPEAQTYSALGDQVYYDALTGARNRRYFYEELPRRIAQQTQTDGGLSLCVFDIDHFKSVNDTHGHDVGDAMLKAVANRLKARTRGADLFARFGGEEFALVLNGVSQEQAYAIAEQFRARIDAEVFACGAVELPISVSIGVAHLQEQDTIETLFRRADQQLLAAKEAGRNCVR